MTSASPAVTVLACAELTEWTKLNVEIPFPAIPSVAELIDAMNRVFSFELQQHLQQEQQKGASNQGRSSSQPISMRRFEVESVTVYDDSLVRWVDLNSSAQLHPFDQLYVFGKGIPPYAGAGGASDSDNGLPPPKLSDYFHYHQPPAAAAQSTSSVQPVQQQQQQQQRRSTSNHNFIADEQQPAHHQARPQQQQQQQQQAQPLGASSREPEPQPQQPRAAAYQQQQPAQQTRDNGHYAQRPREEQQQQPSSVMAAHGQTTMQQQPPAQHQNARPMQSTPQPTPPPGHHQQSTPGRSQQDPAKVSKVYAYADRAGRGHGPISFHDFHSVMNSVYIAFDDRTLQDMFVHFSTGSVASANANGTGGNDQQSSQPVMSHQDFSVWASHYPRTFDALHHRLADREIEDAKRNDLSQVQRELDRMTQRRRQLEDEMRKLDAEVEGRTQQFASLDREVQDVQRGRRALCDDEQVLLDKEVKIAHNRILLQQEEQDYERTAKQLDMRRSQARQPSSSSTQHYAQQQPSQHY